MSLRIKNWDKFQHYKDRNPPWIKLATDTFQNYDFACLQDASKLLAICYWTIAARSKDGSVPADLEWVKRQCNLGKSVTQENLNELINKGFIIGASDMLANCLQDASPETEGYSKETEVETEGERGLVASRKKSVNDYPDDFETFWSRYPQNGASKKSAFQSYTRAVKEGAEHETIIRGVAAYSDYANRTGTPIAHATTWLNQQRWTVDYANLNDRSRTGGQHQADSPHARMGRAWAEAAGIDTGRQDD